MMYTYDFLALSTTSWVDGNLMLAELYVLLHASTRQQLVISSKKQAARLLLEKNEARSPVS